MKGQFCLTPAEWGSGIKGSIIEHEVTDLDVLIFFLLLLPFSRATRRLHVNTSFVKVFPNV